MRDGRPWLDRPISALESDGQARQETVVSGGKRRFLGGGRFALAGFDSRLRPMRILADISK